MVLYFLAIYLAFILNLNVFGIEDKNGYIIYCPCMGRFGNQADQFLGSIAFAKALNRTLVLPPWISYPRSNPGTSVKTKFNRYFKVEPLRQYHKVITMEKFMKSIAPSVWPIGERKGFCYMYQKENSCRMKEGNPFGPFWDHFDINFDEEIEHKELLWSTDDKNIAGWNARYPPSSYPVIALKGAPGSFPSLREHQHIQKYIHFSDIINKLADEYIASEMKGEKYLAIHLRNGIDMTRVCDDISDDKYKKLFSSEQCTDRGTGIKLTKEMCNPPKKEIIEKVVHFVKERKLKALFIATDNDPMITDFKKALKRFKVTIHQRVHRDTKTEADGPIIDLAIMNKADMFIGNCVSSFTAFVRRQRLSRNKPIAFFNLKTSSPIHTEL